jgi:vesicular inhibitory amino acid transporter
MSRNPTNWDEYQYGTSHRDSVSSDGGRSVRFDEAIGSPSAESPLLGAPGSSNEDGQQNLRRRRHVSQAPRTTLC